MSLASELLYSTSKRAKSDSVQGRAVDPLKRLIALNHVVYGLIAEHEPSGSTEALLRADIKIMRLSGLIDEQSDAIVTGVCKQAASVMAELVRVLPRCRE